MKIKLFFFLFSLLWPAYTQAQVKYYFIGLGGEKDWTLSHANSQISIQNRYREDGEAFIVHVISASENEKKITLECCGKEKGLFLSHAFAKICLHKGYMGDGEIWLIKPQSNGNILIKGYGKESNYYLSHANKSISLRKAYGGEGELWSYANTNNSNTLLTGTLNNNSKDNYIESICSFCVNGKCQFCYGAGVQYINGYSLKCHACAGSGKCSHCHGAGKIRYYQNNVPITNGGSTKGNSGSSTTNQMDNHKCRTCNGTGKCSRCKGKCGDYEWIYGSKQWINCASCDGKGECPICYGTGRI